MKAIPRGPENLVCPLHRKAMEAVCHTCPLWMSVRGKNPQTGEELDDWNCALAWGPLLAVSVARETHAASVELNQMRNETKKAHDEHMTMAAIAVQRASEATEGVIAKYAGGYAPALPLNSVPALQALEAHDGNS